MACDNVANRSAPPPSQFPPWCCCTAYVCTKLFCGLIFLYSSSVQSLSLYKSNLWDFWDLLVEVVICPKNEQQTSCKKGRVEKMLLRKDVVCCVYTHAHPFFVNTVQEMKCSLHRITFIIIIIFFCENLAKEANRLFDADRRTRLFGVMMMGGRTYEREACNSASLSEKSANKKNWKLVLFNISEGTNYEWRNHFIQLILHDIACKSRVYLTVFLFSRFCDKGYDN